MNDVTRAHHEPAPPSDVAEYVRDLTRELAALSRQAGMTTVATLLDRAHDAASASLEALQSPKAPALDRQA
jgi:hypothetical protein